MCSLRGLSFLLFSSPSPPNLTLGASRNVNASGVMRESAEPARLLFVSVLGTASDAAHRSRMGLLSLYSSVGLASSRGAEYKAGGLQEREREKERSSKVNKDGTREERRRMHQGWSAGVCLLMQSLRERGRDGNSSRGHVCIMHMQSCRSNLDKIFRATWGHSQQCHRDGGLGLQPGPFASTSTCLLIETSRLQYCAKTT